MQIGVRPSQRGPVGNPDLDHRRAFGDAEQVSGLGQLHRLDGTVGSMTAGRRDGRRWVVLGAGAIGGTIGGRLAQGGAEVAFVARGAHGAALADGLVFRDPDGEVRLAVPTVFTPAEIGWRDGDVAILATKTQDALPAIEALAAAAPATPVVCATNGVEAERLALRRFEAVHGMCVMLPAAHLAPGIVEASSAPCSGVLDVGLATGGTDDVDHDLAAALRAGAFVADAEPDVMRRKRTKLLLNLANVLDAACGRRHGTGEIIRAAKAEGVAVFDAAGLTYASDEEDLARRGDHIQPRPVGGAERGGGSTWQSLARGLASTEADYLNGEIVLLGRQHGVATPVNAGLQRLARHLVATGASPGAMPVDELDRWIRPA